MNDIILITGGTGHIGSELTALFANDPTVREVRVATRNPASAKAQLLRDFNPDTVRPVAFDINDDATIRAAFEGVTKLCLIAPLSDQMPVFHQKVVDAAVTQQVSYIVKVSVGGAGPDASGPGAAHWQGEELIRQSGIPATMFRPPIFIQHFLMVPGLYERGDDRFYLPTGDAKLALLDCRDIAVAAYCVLTDPAKAAGLPNGTLPLTGPQALTGRDIADVLSQLNGKAFRQVADETAFVQHSQATKSPLEVKAVYEARAQGAFSQVQTDVFEQIVGRKPNSFARFAWDNQYYFS